MHYLRSYHLKHIAAEPAMATVLWQSAMNNARHALNREQYAVARHYFGAAFETALLALTCDQPERFDELDAHHLHEASRQLTHVLEKLGCAAEAHACLQTVARTLSHKTMEGQESARCSFYEQRERCEADLELNDNQA